MLPPRYSSTLLRCGLLLNRLTRETTQNDRNVFASESLLRNSISFPGKIVVGINANTFAQVIWTYVWYISQAQEK